MTLFLCIIIFKGIVQYFVFMLRDEDDSLETKINIIIQTGIMGKQLAGSCMYANVPTSTSNA